VSNLALRNDDVATEEAGELASDGKPKTRAPGLSRQRLINLPEGFENVLLILR